jgi:protein phosphatase 2C family protein 2/3
VIREKSFPADPRLAIIRGFEVAEKKFTEINVTEEGINLNSMSLGVIDRSGSCAIVTLIVGDMCYNANVGDS